MSEELTMSPPFTQRPVTRTYSDENAPPSSTESVAGQSLDSRPKPSAGWLRNPAWIGKCSPLTLTPLAHNFTVKDGGVNPPHFYYTHEEIDNTLRVNGLSPARVYERQADDISPTPILPAPPAPLTLDLVNSVPIPVATVCGRAEVPGVSLAIESGSWLIPLTQSVVVDIWSM